MILPIIIIALCLISIGLNAYSINQGVKLTPVEKDMLRQCITNNIDALVTLSDAFDPEIAAQTLQSLDKIKDKLK